MPGLRSFLFGADVLQAIAAAEIAMLKIGKNIEAGAGVKAAQEVYFAEGEK